jgi:Alw26I/Eco31I/Esp3I family type II restriction m6 adenine DNA methyltransferase
MGLFQSKIIRKYIQSNGSTIQNAYNQFVSYFHNLDIQENIRNSKEEQFQEGFLRELFVKVLGYTLNPEPNFNLITEQKNETDSKKADAAILVNGEVRGIVELKDRKTPDLKTIENQAFGYKHYHKNAAYVVTSNFEKLRFYIDTAVEFEEFNLFSLTLEDFSVLWTCLAYENISKDIPKRLKTESVSNEDQITKELYKDYSRFKRELFDDLTKQNPQYDQLLLFKKSQKLLDRLLFIFFAEDRDLLPANSMAEIINQWEKLRDLDEYRPLYDRFKKYFGYMNTGFKGKTHDIFAYNGGLFKEDDVLDNIIISDVILRDNSLRLSQYDFESEVDVNILGHIFENSLTEIEEISQSISKGEVAPQTSKRKKDGVFYTPRYITTYIVENTLGKLCAEKKAELEIDESEYFTDKKRQKATIKKLADKLTVYREWLLSLTICDPACGSGAFLNAALDFLINEHTLLDDLNAKLFSDAIVFPDIENAILENNLYGVDINEESVEIAKLALWLRTAKPQRKLNSLNNNIKCGNSLISDSDVAGEKAFDWQKEFPQVFEKGGFDVVIGNPPYGEVRDLSLDLQSSYRYNCRFYEYAKGGRLNLFQFFYPLAIEIVKFNGIISLITQNSILAEQSALENRRLIFKTTNILLIDSFPERDNVKTRVFEAVKMSVCICTLQKKEIVDYSSKFRVNVWHSNNMISSHHLNISKQEIIDIYADELIIPICDNFQFELIKKIKLRGDRMKIIANAGEIDMTKYKSYFSLSPNGNNSYRVITGAQIQRYYITNSPSQGSVIYLPEADISSIKGSKSEAVYYPRIIMQRITGVDSKIRIIATMAKEGILCANSTNYLSGNENRNIKYLLAVINSKLINFHIKQTSTNTNITTKVIEDLPIINLNEKDSQRYDAMVDYILSLKEVLIKKVQKFINRLIINWVEIKMTIALHHFHELDFKGFLSELKKQKITLSLKQQDEWEEYFNEYKSDCNTISTQIAQTDKTIDNMVYELYGLTEEEIEVVEKS